MVGLAIHEHVKKERLNPGRYFVLRFDFSTVHRSRDQEKAAHSLNQMLNNSIAGFYRTYEPYLRMSADYLIEKYINDDATSSMRACVQVIYLMADEYDSNSNERLVLIDSVQSKPPRQADTDSLLEGFWATVKSGLSHRKIAKCYMTGVVPQSFADTTSGFNVARYVSWEPELAGFCGLTEAVAAAALALKSVYGSTSEAEKHLKIMGDNYNDFNLNFAIGNPMKDPLSVTNSEASESGELARSRAAWLSYVVHIGGLTFCVGKKALRISNLVVAARFGSAILHRHQATLEDVDGAFRLLVDDGNIDRILGLYARGMQEHDVGAHDFQKKEEEHCNSMRFTLLANIHPSLRKVGVETTITKERANALAEIRDANKILDLKFRSDKFRTGQTIKKWILDGPKFGKGCSSEQQLGEYAESPEIEAWKKDGYTITPILLVVVGSRHVLLWNLDGDKLDSSPRLAA
ncbi:hypothetical protein EC957_008138 [Mortierella hygrophila]|uniref:AAA-ATPase-like domain-containing protein n=1 Tax=Mortierella hygrophila TaxID=979708 RepID=A0A9P6FIF9_9FUNG|nr:hypothetical protein EC957_008138 [Mortierella hygrophila]